ncbi:telomere repeat-binding factor 4-like [Cynara cardunculus var. scolymus]|uniref:telomere repeat-binding factor 4-like n=1 Tax=Cynara cardunculus var. scolymus TaxID=59895 RepID=UPI000D6247A1|nr:telomere repeat-binding factor 4-like [Cynara cardunculus var. scolymus]XP_024970708.1 telomere repeat-binding factor 4-like [Cynara cardunculus var. scolymus]
MAKQKQKWTTEEEYALCAGVEKHGHGKWKVILSDPEFASSLANRSNIDLKDKWRNLGSSGGMPSSREKVRPPRLEGVGINSLLSSPEPLSAVPLLEYGDMAEPSRSSVDRRTVPEYEAMIFEALFNIDDPNGPDANKIMDFIELRYEVPQNFRRSVTSKLRRLVLTGELEKVDNCYKFKNAFCGAEPSQLEDVRMNNPDNRNGEQQAPEGSLTPLATDNTPEDSLTPLATEKAPEDSPTPLATENTPEDSPTPLATENAPEDSPTPLAIENAPMNSPTPVATAQERAPPPIPTETLEDAALYAVYAVAVAENVEQEAADACKKAELLAEALEESTATLMLIEELHKQWSELH